VVSKVDCQLMNEFDRIKRPFDGALDLARMVNDFLSVVKCAPSAVLSASDLSWAQVQKSIRKAISNNLYEFKGQVKALVMRNGSFTPQLTEALIQLKNTYLGDLAQVKKVIAGSRTLSVLTQLVWTTVCCCLELPKEANALLDNDVLDYNSGNVRSVSRSAASRSRSPIIVTRTSSNPIYN